MKGNTMEKEYREFTEAIARNLTGAVKELNDSDLESRDSVEHVPEEDIAVAISCYIFAQCEAQEDWCVQDKGVFGGWNRVCVNHQGWWASKSHCTKDFMEKLGERCPWVKTF
jgi:hypothetical protein